jgi:HAMP domain-containing protein/anti-sigma regulatory factor (Ser/Thr protein kinase)
VGTKSSEPIHTLAKPEGFVSVASRLAIVIFALVAGVSLLVAFELTRREREHYIASKQRAGSMLTELFASSIVPALDFADSEAVQASLGMLSQNREVVDAVVWPAEGNQPLARLRPSAHGALASAPRPGILVAEGHIDFTLPAKSPTGKTLGLAWVRVSLAHENAAFAEARRKIFWLASGLSALIAGLLIAVIRRTIISPLARLERAARRLARGELIELGHLSRDEIGMLGRTFKYMANAIREREERVVAVNGRLQGLLDNMRQAIVVFDGEGRLASERSRLARELFGSEAGENTNIVELLFPQGRAPDVEREAFRAWLGEAATARADDFEELRELAPREVRLFDDRYGERLLELEFRGAESELGEPRILLLGTDVTSQRKLERTAETREREHEKQLVAMRRLLAGGGQVFVRFLASARERLGKCRLELETQRALTSETVESVFRFVHTLRAEARSFDLRSVEELALGMEVELVGARHAPQGSPVRATAHETVSAGCEELARELDAAEDLFVKSSPIGRRVLEQVTVSRADVDALYKKLGGRSDDIGVLVSRLAARPFGELISMLPDSVQRWATKDGKRVELTVSGREVLVPAELSERLAGVLAHLLRNAVAHGIETPAQRRELGKSDAGHIELSCREQAGGVVIVVCDDGAGFDVEALAMATEGAGPSLSPIERAFLPGVSTRETPDDLAGLGVGLGAVREELRKAGYLVSMGSDRGKGATALIEPNAPEPDPLHG